MLISELNHIQQKIVALSLLCSTSCTYPHTFSLLCVNRKRERNIPVLAGMASKLLVVVLFVFNLIAFAAAVATEQRTKHLCHDNESLALLQFKESLMINCFASNDPSAYSKVSLWESKSSNCCGWHGIKCDEDTGHVVSLDLSSSCLFGPINSNSSLFQLVHLQKLNLADNWFNDSQIPTRFRQLSRLTNLNLSHSFFSGQITSTILGLSNLVSLDLSGHRLELSELGLKSMAQNLTNLKELHLSDINMSSTVPKALTNFSSLTSLFLDGCHLHGEFPIEIFHLPNLQSIDVANNWDLNGSIPEFNQSSPLESLELSRTSFFGKLPDSMSNLTFLQHVGVIKCNFFGPIPSSFGNLAQLVSLQVLENRLYGEFPTGIFHLPNLRDLEVGFNENLTLSLAEFNRSSPLEFLDISSLPFSSKLQHSIGNLKSLSSFIAIGCNFSGPIPSSIGNLTQLKQLYLTESNLQGSIPKSISKLVNLEYLDLDLNYLNGIVGFDLFLKLKKLHSINLSNNNITLLTKPSTNATFPKFQSLILSDCYLSEFPNFLRNQDQLTTLDLSWNEIHGQVPKWMWDVSKNTLLTLDMSFNSLTGFDEFPVFSPQSKLLILRLDSNKLKGPPPIPPPSIIWYSVANNKMVGEIPHLICNMSSIITLDLSSNNLSGSLPQCLSNLSSSLLVLNLHGNKFHGTIPQSFAEGNELEMIDLSQNQLWGPIPKSLANCIKLEVLNLGDNQINDSFPFWLGGLSRLKVLILRTNRFYGAIGNPNSYFDFPNLRVVDLSNNDIIGELPSQYFQTWKAMQIINETGLMYMEANIKYGPYSFSMKIFNKGNEMVYEKILDYFMAIDLSNNRFRGEIPEVVGHLKGLKLLNLSNNFLTGHIPSSLGNLIKLESLDLSQNNLSGTIPLQLVQLNFLAFLSISHNHLTGLIPSGQQFDTFPNTSFSDNLGLCGSPLSKKCKNFEHSHSPASTFGDNQNLRCLFEFSWKVVATRYVCAFIVGLVLGITKKHDWLTKTFAGAIQHEEA